jgi:hypothetical protein
MIKIFFETAKIAELKLELKVSVTKAYPVASQLSMFWE